MTWRPLPLENAKQWTFKQHQGTFEEGKYFGGLSHGLSSQHTLTRRVGNGAALYARQRKAVNERLSGFGIILSSLSMLCAWRVCALCAAPLGLVPSSFFGSETGLAKAQGLWLEHKAAHTD